MKAYKHLLFDLDHTLWDFDTNARETLNDLYHKHDINALGVPEVDDFINVYTEINHQLWRDYHNQVITKDTLRLERFKQTFQHFGVAESYIPPSFYDEYVSDCSNKTNLFAHTHEVLSALKTKFVLHIVTNGFKESSLTKINNTGIAKYFSEVFISEEIGLYKPDIALFNHILTTINATSAECIMIGDSLEADIMGAKNAGIDQVFFNTRNEKAEFEITHEINSLDKLLEVLL